MKELDSIVNDNTAYILKKISSLVVDYVDHHQIPVRELHTRYGLDRNFVSKLLKGDVYNYNPHFKSIVLLLEVINVSLSDAVNYDSERDKRRLVIR